MHSSYYYLTLADHYSVMHSFVARFVETLNPNNILPLLEFLVFLKKNNTNPSYF